MRETIEEFFASHATVPFLEQAESCFQQIVRVLGPSNSAKGYTFEHVIVGSLMQQQWTVSQLIDTFLPSSDPRPAWCADIANHVITFHAHGPACDYGCSNDLEWLKNAQVGEALAPMTSTKPG